MRSWWLCAILLISCGSPSGDTELDLWLADHGKPRVLCTTGMLEDLVTRVAGDRMKCLTLISGQLDPHSYELVKGDDEKLQEADLIFYNGLGLEHGPSLRSYLDNCSQCINIGEYITTQDPSAAVFIDGMIDPHIWTDVSLYALGVERMIETLSELDPEGAEHFAERGKVVRDELMATHNRMSELLQDIPSNKRYLVTSHDAFNYFARAYLAEPDEKQTWQWEKRFEAPEGLSPESQLSPLDIQRLIDYLDQYKVTVLFPESNVSQDSIRKIVDAGRERGLNLDIACVHLYADAMGEPGSDGDSYAKMMEHNARTIAHYLDGMKKP